jgi:hypothetical protein
MSQCKEGGMRTANTIVLVVLALAAAGCGGDADKRATPAANQSRQNGSDVRLAQASLLTIDDVPTGWTAEDDDEDSASTSECPEIKAARASRSGSARAPTLAENGNKTVQHSVMVFPTAVDAKAAHEGMASAETRRCLGEELPTSLGDDLAKEGVTVGDVTTGEFRVEPVGEAAGASRFSVELTAEEQTIPVVVDVVFVLRGRVVSGLLTTDIVTPFDDALRNKLLRTVDTRIARRLRSGE